MAVWLSQSAAMADWQAQSETLKLLSKAVDQCHSLPESVDADMPSTGVIFDEDMTLRAVILETNGALTPVFSIFGKPTPPLRGL